MGTLFYGDNHDILLHYFKDESVALVYLGPFDSAQKYNVFFQERDASSSASQIYAFEDTWRFTTEPNHYDKAGAWKCAL